MKKLSLLLLLPLLCFAKASETKKIIFLGDSLTEGYGIEQKFAYPNLIAEKLKQEGIAAEVINGGVSGSTTASGISRLKWFLKSKPTLIFLALGANDGLRGIKIQESKKNLTQIIELAQANKIKIIIAGMRLPPNYGKEYTQSFDKIYPELAKKYQIPLMPFLIKDVAGKKELNIQDGIHPNLEGHKIMSENVYPYIKENL